MMPCLSLGLAMIALASGDGPGPSVRSCQRCHQQIVETFIQTGHFHTSAEATRQTVKGRFSEGHNVLRTGVPGVYFKSEARDGAFYQTGVDSARNGSRTERIDLVIGSGRRGQTYLYWRSGLLFELPVSYLTASRRWINSPGYPDGQIDFERVIVPQCLDCHSTSFPLNADRRAARYSGDYRLGILCEKCHGPGQAHITYHTSHPADTLGQFILNPARFSRDRKVDNCALCHSGERDPLRPPFSYRPGAALNEYLAPPAARQTVPDVHGNQVGLLQRSKCFRSSPGMSCSTCHDVHQPQRDLATFVPKCLACHQTDQHPMAEQIGSARLLASCIDCHMPNRRSRAIEINTPGNRVALYYRSHEIGIYRDVTAAVLRSAAEKKNP